MCGETLRIETLSLTDLEAVAALLPVYVADRRAKEAVRPQMQTLLDAAQAALSAYETALNGASDPQDPVAQGLQRTVAHRQSELHKLDREATAQAESLNALLQKAVSGNGMLDTVLELPAYFSAPAPAPDPAADPSPPAPDPDPAAKAAANPSPPAPAPAPDPAAEAASEDEEDTFAALFDAPDDPDSADAEAEATVAALLRAASKATPAPADEATPAPADEAAPAPADEAAPAPADEAALEGAEEQDPWLAVIGGGGDPF